MKLRHNTKRAIPAIVALWFLFPAGCGKQEESRPPQFQAESSSQLKNLNWLAGTWQNQGGVHNAFESWEIEDEQAMIGRGYVIKDGDTTISEMLQLEEKDGDIFYVATVAHNPGPVYFKLVKMSEQEFVFENAEHDFPNRIIYMRHGEDSVHVRIEGMGESGGKKIDFMFVRE